MVDAVLAGSALPKDLPVLWPRQDVFGGGPAFDEPAVGVVMDDAPAGRPCWAGGAPATTVAYQPAGMWEPSAT